MVDRFSFLAKEIREWQRVLYYVYPDSDAYNLIQIQIDTLKKALTKEIENRLSNKGE